MSSSKRNIFGSLKRDRKNGPSLPKLSISDPISSVNVTHVSYDADTRSFSGLPVEWGELLGNSFTEEEVTEGRQILMKILPNQQQVTFRTRDLLKRRLARGTLRIRQRGADPLDDQFKVVSEPKKTAKVASVQYDPETGTYTGLPDEWKALLPSSPQPQVYRTRRPRERPSPSDLAVQRQKSLPSPPASAASSPTMRRDASKACSLPKGQPLPSSPNTLLPKGLPSLVTLPPGISLDAGLPKGLPKGQRPSKPAGRQDHIADPSPSLSSSSSATTSITSSSSPSASNSSNTQSSEHEAYRSPSPCLESGSSSSSSSSITSPSILTGSPPQSPLPVFSSPQAATSVLDTTSSTMAFSASASISLTSPLFSSSSSSSSSRTETTTTTTTNGSVPSKRHRILEVEQQFLEANKKIQIGDLVSSGDPNTLFSGFELCGEGASGTVWIADSEEMGIDVAIKKMVLSDQSSTQILVNEVLLMANCSHPAIVSFFDAYLDNGTLWVVMEYIDGEDITDILANAHNFTEIHIATIARETLLALNHLHSKGIMHRDIKSDNILIDIWSGAVKLTDFGFGARLSREAPARTSVVGTTYWMAPEVIMAIAYNASADIWSLGAFVHELCNRHPPYIEAAQMRALFMICKDGLPPLNEPSRWSPALIDFIQLAATMNPDERPSASQLLETPFIREFSADISCLIPVVRETRRIKFNTLSIVASDSDDD